MIRDHRRREPSRLDRLRFWIGVTAEALVVLVVVGLIIIAATAVVPCTQAACGR